MPAPREELSAGAYARRRMLAGFLDTGAADGAPGKRGPDAESAPRPVRAVLPGLVLGAVLLAGFGARDMIRPSAPEDWGDGRRVVVGEQSGTRYVVLRDGPDGRRLHPVLNLASARLLLDPAGAGAGSVTVGEGVLDGGPIPLGAPLGIPYAPDRLPEAGQLGRPKSWAVCRRTSGVPAAAPRAEAPVFVLSGAERQRLRGPGRLTGSQVLQLVGPHGVRRLVDARGHRFRLGGQAGGQVDGQGDGQPDRLLRAALFGEGERARAQRVGPDFLSVLHDAGTLDFPRVPGIGGTAGPALGLRDGLNRIGAVLLAETGGGPQHYLVLRERIAPVGPLTARLLLASPQSHRAYPGGPPHPLPVALSEIAGAVRGGFPERRDLNPRLPEQVPRPVGGTPATAVLCAVFEGSFDAARRPVLGLWAGPDWPAPVGRRAGAYVTPGTGLLYRESGPGGRVRLLTDTARRHRLPGEARERLGYRDVAPVPVPAAWSALLPAGPALDPAAAGSPQHR
jgi:type VII secretion protein EccB